MAGKYESLSALIEAQKAGKEKEIYVFVDIDEYYFNDGEGETVYTVMAEKLVEEALGLIGFSAPQGV